MHTNPCIYIYLYYYRSICISIKANMSSSWCLQRWYTTAWISRAFLPCLAADFHSNSEKLLPTIHHPFTYMYSGFKWLTGTTHPSAFPARVQCLCEVPFAFSLRVSTHFQRYLGQHLFPHSLLRGYFPYILHSAFHPGISWLPTCFLFFLIAFIQVHCCKVLWVLTMLSVLHLPLQHHME